MTMLGCTKRLERVGTGECDDEMLGDKARTRGYEKKATKKIAGVGIFPQRMFHGPGPLRSIRENVSGWFKGFCSTAASCRFLATYG